MSMTPDQWDNVMTLARAYSRAWRCRIRVVASIRSDRAQRAGYGKWDYVPQIPSGTVR